MSAGDKKRVCLGAFAGAHGVRGDVKVRSFTTNPADIAAYGPVESEDGERRFKLTILRVLKDGLLLARAPEIETRECAEILKGGRLFVERALLPEPSDDEYYIEDLVGLAAVDKSGAPIGAVSAVHNFGAGDIIELSNMPGIKGSRLIPFRKETVLTIDFAAETLTLDRAVVTGLR